MQFPPITVELITAVGTAIAVILTALGVTGGAWIGLRKLRPQIDNLRGEANRLKEEAIRVKAEADKFQAEAEQARAERDAAEAKVMETLSNTVNNLLAPLNQQIQSLRAENDELRKRVRTLESKASDQGEKLIEKDLALEKLRYEKDGQISILTVAMESMRCKNEQETGDLHREIDSLRQLVADYRSGKKKPTGQLPEVQGEI